MPPPAAAAAAGAGLAAGRSFSSSSDRLAGGGGGGGGPLGPPGAAPGLAGAAALAAGAAGAAVPAAALAAAMLPPEGFHLTPVGMLTRTKACRPVNRSCRRQTHPSQSSQASSWLSCRSTPFAGRTPKSGKQPAANGAAVGLSRLHPLPSAAWPTPPACRPRP